MTFTMFNVTVLLLLSASFIAARGLPAKSGEPSPLKIKLPKDFTEKTARIVVPAAPEDEIAMEDRRRAVVAVESEEGTEGSQEDSPIYEAELMSGDDAGSSADDAEDDAQEEGDASSDSQHLFPSFSSLFAPSSSLGHHSRPFYPQLAAAPPVPARAFAPSNVYHRSIYSADDAERVLGSGNFGVIRGGTYYGGGAADEPYTRGSNSHGRPYRRPNPLPQFRHGGDFFSGFRDFADITTAPKTAYSQIFVVYANRNTTNTDSSDLSSAPKNIRDLIERDGGGETLGLMDDDDHHSDDASIKSKTKRKLTLHKKKMAEKEASKKFRNVKEVEPLLALS